MYFLNVGLFSITTNISEETPIPVSFASICAMFGQLKIKIALQFKIWQFVMIKFVGKYEIPDLHLVVDVPEFLYYVNGK